MGKLFKQFLKFVKKMNLNIDDVKYEQRDQYELVQFIDAWETDKSFITTFVIYDNQDIVEIYLMKNITREPDLEYYKQLNKLNEQYSGFNFFYDEYAHTWSMKEKVSTHGNMNIAIKAMINDLQIATVLFDESIFL